MTLAADHAHSYLSRFINDLNADKSLYDPLFMLRNSSKLWNSLDSTEKLLCDSLLLDFERGGVHLIEEKRKKVVQLQSELAKTCHDFTLSIHSNNHSSGDALIIESEQIETVLPARIFDSLKKIHRDNQHFVEIPLDSDSLSTLIQFIPDAQMRRRVWRDAFDLKRRRTSVELLEKMLKLRKELAECLGFHCFSDLMFDRTRVAKNVDEVWRFLETLSESIDRKARSEVQLLLNAKRIYENHSEFSEQHSFDEKQADIDERINEFDVQYYTSIVRFQQLRPSNQRALSLRRFFSIERVLYGLNLILNRLFGVNLVCIESTSILFD
eukprot:CAMPEP_0182451716 /NCGR_PEP_ID=MMETSP1172-20130603/43868_1 /TAXON_ID=708627 /ORGANISM="Timspurckia oligopyrenoides, Strain CCMP3278" /LENGTH=324 /DNA_ID=CAMNT_0024649507 /DNA_START=294 /DNA_END=1268 /DNA_ORIENTATION=-